MSSHGVLSQVGMGAGTLALLMVLAGYLGALPQDNGGKKTSAEGVRQFGNGPDLHSRTRIGTCPGASPQAGVERAFGPASCCQEAEIS